MTDPALTTQQPSPGVGPSIGNGGNLAIAIPAQVPPIQGTNVNTLSIAALAPTGQCKLSNQLQGGAQSILALLSNGSLSLSAIP